MFRPRFDYLGELKHACTLRCKTNETDVKLNWICPLRTAITTHPHTATTHPCASLALGTTTTHRTSPTANRPQSTNRC